MSLFFGAIGVLTIVLLFISVFGGVQIPEDKALRKTITKSIGVIKNKPLSDSLTIDMVRLTTFQWDTLYVFSGDNSEDFISQAIGVSWNKGETSGWYDANPDNLFIFKHKGKIVSYVWYEGFGGEPTEPDFIHFQMHLSNAELFTPTTARFNIFREKRDPNFIQLIDSKRKNSIYRPGFNPQNVSRIDWRYHG
ncbi:hypothetical protein [Hymenobacter cheonanensis]|uniref:hypothetical protein n=1 Tax=Hymenobacter sp. CA2-7 TaxID=3063993 RepID=UPI002713BFCB|nr:hypothetical protein [Hymenobacter sp. CA2-7]MDO7884756.1 hypothetical protein [Hymenobacter sp. CA2-7]